MEGIVVTGAAGFVGRELTRRLTGDGLQVVATSRRTPPPGVIDPQAPFVECDLASGPDPLRSTLSTACAVVHLAAQVHILNPGAAQRDAYARNNADTTLALAQTAAAAGVRRFVFVSTIKVNGEATDGTPFAATDTPDPQDEYGRSKWAAEQGLRRIATETGLEVVVVRPPLVYGPQVRGNFRRMLALADRAVPLPLASVRNTRSLISVWNLCDLLALAVRHPAAPGRVWLCSDGRDLSTPELFRLLARGLGRRAPLFPCPPALLRAAGSMLGRRDEVERLCGSLQVDDGPIRRELGWSPPLSIEDGLARTCAWYREAKSGAAPP
ncbi:MAG: NAD-dependent epimerase/dehydratase family protein [Dehalococcoidia bacterium]